QHAPGGRNLRLRSGGGRAEHPLAGPAAGDPARRPGAVPRIRSDGNGGVDRPVGLDTGEHDRSVVAAGEPGDGRQQHGAGRSSGALVRRHAALLPIAAAGWVGKLRSLRNDADQTARAELARLQERPPLPAVPAPSAARGRGGQGERYEASVRASVPAPGGAPRAPSAPTLARAAGSSPSRGSCSAPGNTRSRWRPDPAGTRYRSRSGRRSWGG